MSIEKQTKINKLLTTIPEGIVLQSFWLKEQGYSPSLQQRYRKSNWLQSLGKGAMCRTGEKTTYEGAVYALQNQSHLSIHPGGLTALAYLGKAHYSELSARKAILFGSDKERIPKWLTSHNWGVTIEYYSTNFLPEQLGLEIYNLKNFSIKISGAARAMMECLYQLPEKHQMMEYLQIMEGLNNLRPNQVQELLEQCNSIRVKLLFLYLAERVGLTWLKDLRMDKIDLGRVANGVYNPTVYT